MKRVDRGSSAACLTIILVLATGGGLSAQEGTGGTYHGYFVCMGQESESSAELRFAEDAEGWIEGELRIRAPDGTDPLEGGAIGLAGWIDGRAGLFRFHSASWIGGRRPFGLRDFTIFGHYLSDREALLGWIDWPGCGDFGAARDADTAARLSSDRRPRTQEDQRTLSLEREIWFTTLERVNALRIMERSSTTLRPGGGSRQSLSCGAYHLYYDPEFMRRHPTEFYPRDTRGRVSHGFTISQTPPDAGGPWIDEVETISYALGAWSMYTLHSRGRRIPRDAVRPVPYDHRWAHRVVKVGGRECPSVQPYRF